ncbi:MAG: 1,4-alpha-glucan branching protein GlgB [Eubacterium sp.]|nr:1,4-alpha-glucan branching protein GlgB [Eubacterium sp.]
MSEKKSGAGSRLTDELIYLFNEGKYYNAYNTFGAHLDEEYIFNAGERPASGVRFTVWAPGVESVRVVGDFNGWNVMGSGDVYDLKELQHSGIWTGFVPGARPWQLYKYNIGYRDDAESGGVKAPQASADRRTADTDVASETGEEAQEPQIRYMMKADPFAFTSESRPGTASRIADMTYEWQDDEWMDARSRRDIFRSPMNIYEMHLGSWRRHEDGTFLTYVELADILPDYLKSMGYTHVEFLPLMEHPFDSSWGYQVTGYYAPSSRYGSPGDLRYLIDRCHQAGIGVILDWVPGHFCMDEHGLGQFNGNMLYESCEHPEWGTYKFDFSRPQVRSFLLSNAMYWIEEYHVDGIRVDSVTSMLYLNFGVKDEKTRRYNMFGDERDLDAMEFLKEFNYMVGTRAPGVFTIAEESTAWPHVTAPPDAGGLGFHYKWHMGWMNDTLEYMKTDFPDRCYEHDRISTQPAAAFNENYVLALSHDEVVHGKRSLISKMPGDIWRQFAGIRLLTLYQMTHPGKKLNFMGHEIAEFIEWRDYEGLEWFMLDHENHRKYNEFIRDINHLYLKHPALWDNDSDWRGFRWIDAENSRQQIFTYIRRSLTGSGFDDTDKVISAAFPADSALSENGTENYAEEAESNAGEALIVVLNASAETYDDYRIGVPGPGAYVELINSDDVKYAGSGRINRGFTDAVDEPAHGMPYSIRITMPPLGGCIFAKK